MVIQSTNSHVKIECCKKIVPNGVIWPYLHRDNPDGCDSCPFCLVLPCLVKLQQVSNHLELIKPNPKDHPHRQRKDAELAAAGIPRMRVLWVLSNAKHCGKMRALEKLMFSWLSLGDKVLLFSYSVRMLDILEKFLIHKGCCFSRLDGSTPTGVRQSLVDDFNSSPSKQVSFDIWTGGLGLNLVSANRVVIFDPNWNPAQDLQAQDRSLRYGQKQHVAVFRLLAAGSLEELVYTRQVYKQQLANIASRSLRLGVLDPTFQDCREFQGELFGICNLFRDLSDKLFTSEIIELHEKQGIEHGDCESSKQIFTELQRCFLPQKELTNTSAEASQNSKPKDASKEPVEPVLEDLGIVYAHRNEDIVNYGPWIQGDKELDTNLKGTVQHSLLLVARRRKSEAVAGSKNTIENAASSKMRKKSQYSLLAQFMGMEEVEFSKWLLSAYPEEREKVLRDYKRRKDKNPNG
ncbi:unnamed protein product [Coffea canephora]|uniref:Helicase C-terminal domain-containing protein n=1 Tax=Coffea canephora TaxID=49390 RepID=A0A068V4L5_COFCA|nr:unnamed protein product [Coffea canephora]